MTASAPLATAAAMLVPLNTMWFVSTRNCGYVLYRYSFVVASDTRRWPGATRSGFGSASYHVGPAALYGVSRSSPRSSVFAVSNAPTVIADGALPGQVMPAYPACPVSGFTP